MTETFPTGYPIIGQTDGFVMLGRWSQLFVGAVRSLWLTEQVPSPEDETFWHATAVVVILPSLVAARFGTADADEQSTLGFLQSAARRFAEPLGLQTTTVLASGRVGVVRALRAADELLRSGRCERVLIAAVDSYLDPLTLDWLVEARRLKQDEQPVGLRPGEAGACVLLETEAAARARSKKVMLRVGGLAEAQGSVTPDQPPNSARQLADVVQQCLEQAGTSRRFAGEIISDHNGEAWRAAEYGSARMLLAQRLSPSVREIFPAKSLGEVGAASSIVGLCVAAHSFSRGCSAAGAALVLVSTEQGRVGALCVSAA